MKGRSAVLAALATSATAVALAVPVPAGAHPIDKGHFDEVFTSDVYDCDGTPAQDAVDIHVNFNFNLRGSSPFPYYRESLQGSVITTNLLTGGTYTQVFTNNRANAGGAADVIHRAIARSCGDAPPVISRWWLAPGDDPGVFQRRALSSGQARRMCDPCILGPPCFPRAWSSLATRL